LKTYYQRVNGAWIACPYLEFSHPLAFTPAQSRWL